MYEILKTMGIEEQVRFLNHLLPLDCFNSPERKEEVITTIVNEIIQKEIIQVPQ